MDFEQIKILSETYYMNTFGERQPMILTHGSGSTLYDQTGKAYTDLLAGIAVCALGYGHPALTEAIETQAKKLIHCSNYFYTEEQARLAALLCENTCADRVFFSNSGAEANEGAIKLARKVFFDRGENRYEIISMDHSFHGRTLATLAATGQKKYREAYLPMPEGFINVPYRDIEAVRSAIGEHTAAVLVEPIQGEGGVIEGGAEYLKALRALCDEKGILLIFDEIQCGMGRTGKLFAHQAYGVEPDIFTVAKALCGGIPSGAILAKENCCAFKPGDHGTTFGGNPLACAAGIAVLEEILKPGFLDEVECKGSLFKFGLEKLMRRYPDKIIDVRGMGLMLGAQLVEQIPAKKAQGKLIQMGFLPGTAGQNTLRFLPPLVIEEKRILAFLDALDELLKGWEL